MSWTPKVGDQVIYNGETMEVVEPPTGMFDRTLVRSDDLLM
jgi:hypothetical protein